MGGKVLDYEAKRIYNEASARTKVEVEAKERKNSVVYMFQDHMDEALIRQRYPEQFDAGKAMFLNMNK